MAIMTKDSHVRRAMDFFSRQDLYAVIGKTSPWEDDNNPPLPQEDDVIEEVIGYKRIGTKILVRPSTESEISGGATIPVRGNHWTEVAFEDAYDQGARWVLLECEFTGSDFPTDIAYRQVGIVSELVPTAGAGEALSPSEVTDPGTLEIIENRKPIYREANQYEGLAIIADF